MANRDAPMGFIPTVKLDGSIIPTRWYPVDDGNATRIGVGDTVKAMPSGDVNFAGAGEGADIIGVVVAIADTKGNSAGHPNGDLSTKYLPATTAGKVNVALFFPDCVFRIQTDGTIAETGRFASANHVATACDTITARSKAELNSSLSTDAGFKIIDKVDEPGNAWGEFVELLVVPSESYWFQDVNGV